MKNLAQGVIIKGKKRFCCTTLPKDFCPFLRKSSEVVLVEFLLLTDQPELCCCFNKKTSDINFPSYIFEELLHFLCTVIS